MPPDFAETVRPLLERLLEADEELRGVVAATQQKTFSGSLYAVGVTDRRLILQRLDRRLQPKGEAEIVTPAALASAHAEGAGGGWWTAPAAILDQTAIALTLETTEGSKLKLQMMRGEGLLGGLGGGETQRAGIEALAEWLRAALGEG
jgi:hypothetical protein